MRTYLPPTPEAASRGGRAPRGSSSPSRRALRDFASDHQGHFTKGQAVHLGVTGDLLHRMELAGEIVRRHENVWAFAGIALTWAAELYGDVLAAGEGAVASRAAALRLHSVQHEALPYRREVTRVGGSRSYAHPDVVYHRTPRLDEVDRSSVLGVPCTSRARTLIDLAAVVHGMVLLALTDALVDFKVCTREHLHARALALHAGRRGVAFLVRLAAPGGEVAFRSWLERRGAALLRWAGLPLGAWNVRIAGAPGAGIVDTLFAEQCVVIEWDGLRFHAGAGARQRDNDKGNAIAVAEHVLLRFTYADVVLRPLYVVRMVAQALGLPAPRPTAPVPAPPRLFGVSLAM